MRTSPQPSSRRGSHQYPAGPCRAGPAAEGTRRGERRSRQPRGSAPFGDTAITNDRRMPGSASAVMALEADSVDVAVLHVPTIKPLDTEAILRAARTDRLGSRWRTTPSSAGWGP